LTPDGQGLQPRSNALETHASGTTSIYKDVVETVAKKSADEYSKKDYNK
jgi:hypothetical protein